MKSFNALRWWTQIHEELNALDHLLAIAENPRTLDYHLDGLVGPSGESLKLTDEEKEWLLRVQETPLSELQEAVRNAARPIMRRAMNKDLLRRKILGPVRTAFATYRRQTVVVAATYKEIIIEDFLLAAFSAKPASMYEYVNQATDQKGKVDLKDVLEAGSKEALLYLLASRSAKQLGQASTTVLVKSVKRITGHPLDPALVERLEQLTLLRNRLVHEAVEFEIQKDEAKEALMTVACLAKQLGLLAQAAAIPTKVVDEPDANGRGDESGLPGQLS